MILQICTAISVVLLVVTFAIYALVPRLRNVHGKILLCYVFSLAIGQAIYLVLAWGTDATGRNRYSDTIPGKFAHHVRIFFKSSLSSFVVLVLLSSK